MATLAKHSPARSGMEGVSAPILFSSKAIKSHDKAQNTVGRTYSFRNAVSPPTSFNPEKADFAIDGLERSLLKDS